MNDTRQPIEPVPWILGSLVLLMVVFGFLSQFLGAQGTLPPDMARTLTIIAWVCQVVVCLIGFFHAKQDGPRLFWIFTPVALLAIMLVFTLIPDFLHQA